jgi:hypothetical protein
VIDWHLAGWSGEDDISEREELTGKVNVGASLERLVLVTVGQTRTDERSMTAEQHTDRKGGRVAQPDEGHEASGATPRVLTFGSPSVGEILADRYQLEEHIGNDSLGRQLYRGIDVILRRPVAVVLRYPGGKSAQEMLTAAVAASRIVHPHLVGVYDAIDEGDRAYVVREWVEGIALRDIVSAGALDAGRSVAIAWAVTDAVAALHATGMAHGNVHPGTVLVAHDGRVVLTDARADDLATPETDIRSIGAVLYCSLTGYWPHAEAGRTSVPDGVRDSAGVLAAPRQVRAGVPTHLDQLTVDLLNRNPPLPPADQLAAQLASYGQGEDDVAYSSENDGLDFEAFDAAAESTAPPRPTGRKFAFGVVGLLVLALAGTLAAARVLGGAGDAPTAGSSSHPTKVPTASAPVQQPANSTPKVVPLTADQLRIVAPKGDRDSEFKNVAKMVDGDPSTVWKTDRYNGRPDFGGLKPGMGVLIDLKTPQQVSSVQVYFNTAGATAELHSGSADAGSTSAGDTTVLSTFPIVGTPKSDLGANALFQGPDQPVRYLMLWITKLPPATDGSGKFQVSISEITVRVQ